MDAGWCELMARACVLGGLVCVQSVLCRLERTQSTRNRLFWFRFVTFVFWLSPVFFEFGVPCPPCLQAPAQIARTLCSCDVRSSTLYIAWGWRLSEPSFWLVVLIADLLTGLCKCATNEGPLARTKYLIFVADNFGSEAA